jgi:uncharacterized protein YkwD
MLGFSTLSASSSRHSLRRLRIAGVSLVLAAVAFVATGGPALAWDGSSFSAGDEQLLFSLTNQDRASAGLNALLNDGYLHQKAEWRAQDMGDRNYFSHTIPPDNNMVFNYMESDGYCFNVAGENIGLSTYGDDIATNRIEVAFMNSVDHRNNILGSWARMGVGAYKAADGRKLYTVLFSIPCGVTVPPPPPAATPTPTPTPVPTPTPTPTPRPTPTPTPVTTPTPAPVTTPMPAPVTTAPAGGSTPAPTARSITVAPPGPGATPTPSDRTAALPSPTPPASTTPASRTPAGSIGPLSPSSGPSAGTSSIPAKAASLRVHEKAVSQGPIDSLFHSLFGGLFGW